MAEIIQVQPRKAVAINPLKTSAPLGAALAFMGLEGCSPLFHGSQGCTAFALVLMVRHFREAIPLQTTAMTEISTILGGAEHVEQAIGNIYQRARPRVIGICTTGLTETRGEDMVGDLKAMRARHPEWQDLALVFAPTPDYTGSLQTGWATAVTAMVEALVPETPGALTNRGQVNILAGCHLTPGDLEELREIVESFGLTPILLPDLSGSLDGHVPDQYIPHTLGGTRLEDIRAMGRSVHTLALGEHLREAAVALERRTGVPFTLFDHLVGLAPNDRLVKLLAELSGRPVPARLRRRRSQLVDAMLDGHFQFSGQRVAIAAEPDLLLALATLLAGLGATVAGAVSSTPDAVLTRVPAERVVIGDLDDLERLAVGCDLLVTHAQGAEIAKRTGIPLFRAGFPLFDRLGAAHRVMVGYQGSRNLIFEIGNIFIDHRHEHTPDQHRLDHHEEDNDEQHIGPQAAAG